ncbi:hypothetical protein MKW94_011131 [Papaver nudicaule]|uniref:FHA domain-containing protein n=1 Tax=Papaver nudicaule TaxID=74823 RepID=A0AA41RSC1_PAPNU|nr:hypothetical protein [Papaver nudicaule]
METITWIPEDDLLLKNAVEKGASLESLAKGAVQFSRQFSILELQERWHSLLYDPDVSAEASLRMSELQESVSNLSPVSRRLGVSDGIKQVSGKRKEESVRSQYYAMRKRNRPGPCSSVDPDCSADLDFLVSPSLQNCIGDGGVSQEQLMFLDDGDCRIGEPILDEFELQDLDFHDYNLDEFQCGDSEIMGGGCVNGFADNVGNEAVGNGMDNSYEHDYLRQDISHILRDNGSFFHGKHENVCSGFRGNQNFGPPIPHDDSSFDQLGYSSPQPAMPILPVDENLGSKDWDAGNAGPHEDDSTKQILPGYAKECGDGLASYDASFGYPYSHIAEILFTEDYNDNDMLGKSTFDSLTSILLSSPNNTSDPKESVALDTGSGVVDAASLVDLDGFEHPLHSLNCKFDDSEIALSTTASVPEPRSPYRINGVICCVLNTEDPEIPCNDDFLYPSEVLPSFVSAAMQHSSVGSSVPTPGKDFAVSRKSEQGLSHIKEEKEHLGTVASPKMDTVVLPEACSNHLFDDDGVAHDIFPESPELISEHAVPAAGQCGSFPEGEWNEVLMEAELEKQSDTGNTCDFLINGQIHAIDQVLLQDVVDGSNKEANALYMIGHYASPHMDRSSVEIAPEIMLSPSISDQEDQLFEDTDDVPCFSDAEAMILDMDLGSCIPDLYSSKEVLRHQYEHSGRAIIRLEQGAYSCLQRAIANQKAFALLYSRHCRHYIKKPEVLLGRTTQDFFVDIDLGRKGCANKISRRQATIKMDENGSFYMKNLGKCPVLVNSKELKTGQRIKLTSNCLIEISGMQFLFEINQNIVRQHLAEKARRINNNS